MTLKTAPFALALCAGLFNVSATQADTVLGVYAGGGLWKSDYSGNAGTDSIDVTQLGLKKESNEYIYAALEHPVPLIPNIRLQYTKLQTNGQGTISQDFTLDNETFTTSANLATELDLSHTDATLYYEILDNWVTLDLGLTARKYDGEITVVNLDDTNQFERVDIGETLPLLYAHAQFDLPFSGWAIGAYGNFVSYDGSSLSDMTASVMYNFESVVDLGFEVGYRRTSLDLDESTDLESDITVDGVFAGINLHF